MSFFLLLNTKEYILKSDWNFGTTDFHSILFLLGAKQLFGSNHSSKYLPLCSAEERKSYRFATTWGRVNDDRIFIFGWSITLNYTVYDFCWFHSNLNSYCISFYSMLLWILRTFFCSVLVNALTNICICKHCEVLFNWTFHCVARKARVRWDRGMIICWIGECCFSGLGFTGRDGPLALLVLL